MKEVAKIYFTHLSVWLYLLIAGALFTLTVYLGYLQSYWYILLLPILIAPFFEWFAHKYILHAQIGNVKKIDIQKGIKKGDYITVEFNGEEKEAEVLSVSKTEMEVGYGWARKMKRFRKFMHVLHYGHHENPNDIPLIFAPILSVIILFISLFLLAFLLTFNLAIATVFLSGVVVYYLHYEWMHLGHHIPGYNHIFPWSNKLKLGHQLHHYRNENFWWGITNSIGDKILGTWKSHKNTPMSTTIRNINHK